MKHQHTLTRGPRYAGKGDHQFYADADNGVRLSTYFLSDEDWRAMGCPDEVVLTVAPVAAGPTADLLAALDRWKNAVRADRNRAHQDPDRRRAVAEATSALEDAYDAYVATPTPPEEPS